ncbi:hypothetical protein FQZ97_910090 [compost metagenome]
MFGHGERSRIHFWLENLPTLQPSRIVLERDPLSRYRGPGPERWKNLCRTHPGLAEAMADQWGRYVIDQLAAQRCARE